MLLGLARDLRGSQRRVVEGDWVAPPTRMLGGSTLGILGLGNIGGYMARLAQALQMQVIAWGPTLTPERAQASGVEYVAHDDLFRRADALFISVKLSDLTRGIVGANELALMKPTSYLVNIARGPIVDEAALVRGPPAAAHRRRRTGRLRRGAAAADHPLARLDNVVLTPHIGWGVERATSR